LWVGDGAGIPGADAVQNRLFPVGCVDFLSSLEFDFANGKDMPGALVEQLHNLRVQLINGVTVFGEAHDPKDETFGPKNQTCSAVRSASSFQPPASLEQV
jgi:hypothetical protein